MSNFILNCRQWLNNRGWDLLRHRKFLELLDIYGVDLVIDVGGNCGQFGQDVRRAGYVHGIISFEPGPEAYSVLQQVVAADPKWEAHPLALGAEEGEAHFKIYRDSRFSSFRQLKEVDMDYREVAVPVRRLDHVVAEMDQFKNAHRRFLKVDTQGFDDQVLSGAEGCLKDFIGVQLECSLSPLYEGQWIFEHAIAYMRKHGFVPWCLRRGFVKKHREYELDVMFFREDTKPK